MLNLVEFTGALPGVHTNGPLGVHTNGPVTYCSSPKPALSSSSSSCDASSSPTSRVFIAASIEESNSDGEILDLTLPIRKRASNDSQPSYKKSLIKRYCKLIIS